MWLVNISTLELEEFVEGSIPPYVALSHRWTSEELTFKEVFKNRIDRTKTGYQKLQSACQVAPAYDVEYIWIDTCCIDKRSSAELSEAINSMFLWYQNAKACLAYLEDVQAGPTHEEKFKASVWFTRAWTLQELLAPEEVYFYDHDWTCTGSRTAHSEIIQEVTGIARDVLTKTDLKKEICVAERMSWAANRVATRTEDLAYSLMGIFGVNMPPLYGEGNKAFLRLQEEILRHTTDTTIFLWGFDQRTNCLLAPSPACFQDFPKNELFGRASKEHAVMRSTSAGIEIDGLTMWRWKLDVYALPIIYGQYLSYVLLVRKQRLDNIWYRVGTSRLDDEPAWSRSKKIVIAWGSEAQGEQYSFKPLLDNGCGYGFVIQTDAALPIRLDMLEYETRSRYPRRRLRPDEYPHTTFDHSHQVEVPFDDKPGYQASINFSCWPSEDLQLFCSLFFDFESRPCLLISRSTLETPAWKASDQLSARGVQLGHFGADVPADKILVKVPSNGRPGESYLFCFDGIIMNSVQLPAELVEEDGPVVFVEFHSPMSWQQGRPSFMKFTMTRSRWSSSSFLRARNES